MRGNYVTGFRVSASPFYSLVLVETMQPHVRVHNVLLTPCAVTRRKRVWCKRCSNGAEKKCKPVSAEIFDSLHL